jgi:hypothetical protein
MKEEIKLEHQLRELQGKYDCSIGIAAHSDDKHYLAGYGHQNEMEQINDAAFDEIFNSKQKCCRG